MKKQVLNLKKITLDQIIEVRSYRGDAIGIIYASGDFVPCNDVEIGLNELISIVHVCQNFWFYFENITEKTI